MSFEHNKRAQNNHKEQCRFESIGGLWLQSLLRDKKRETDSYCIQPKFHQQQSESPVGINFSPMALNYRKITFRNPLRRQHYSRSTVYIPSCKWGISSTSPRESIFK
ncbi:hypothetical protein CEXT_107401 [Caerostris extrusa]|uniref:Uncharacterized protein n=1 Tax=Caerostris extrusa TaxID=172846 RepID=A0AAV4PS24_CAEEX|nr:hypothetical protein CEXT_107401 [Caerostris extrusa]